jgi:hypothetical protein
MHYGISHAECEVIEAVPAIMHKNNWLIGEKLMEKWLGGQSLPLAEHGEHDVNTIKLDWVLRFPRARSVYNKAINGRVWINKAAQREIKEYLARTIVLPTKINAEVPFGNVGETLIRHPHKVHQFHKENQIQYVLHDNYDDPKLDDLSAALANFSFNFVVKGSVKCVSEKPARYKVTINKVGVYVGDVYDFSDRKFHIKQPTTYISQPLGAWSKEKMDVSKNPIVTPFSSYHYLTNETYCYYRTTHDRGGDFLVFSDIRILDNRNDTFEF